MEQIVVCRVQIEEGGFFRSSRVGCSYVENGETKSVLFAPADSPYTVAVQEVMIPEELQFKAAHVFVSRYVNHMGITVPVETWRYHFDAWPEYRQAAPLYCEQIDRFPDGKGHIWRHSFEHVAGPRIVNPYLLAMQISSGEVQHAVIERDLVPERLQYKDTYDVLPHPGALPVELGILGQYEDLMQRTKPTTRAWVN